MCEEIEIDPVGDHCWNRSSLDQLKRNLHCSDTELCEILLREEFHPSFDALKVRDSLREEHDLGRDPYLLVMGQLEFASFLHFVYRGFGEESGSCYRKLYFLGVRVVSVPAASHLEFISDPNHPVWGAPELPSQVA
ncbi:hypothetical protein N9A94_05465 [Akkermansiaceae bacterium]|nr:hypothetical protein [Akkermansiaceae bacterium]